MRMARPPRRLSLPSWSRTLFFSPLGPNESPVVGRLLSVQKQTAFVVTTKRHEGNRLETSGGGGGGHEEIASLPSNDVTTNANLITGPDIANRPGPVAAVVWGVSSIAARRPVLIICKQIEVSGEKRCFGKFVVKFFNNDLIFAKKLPLHYVYQNKLLPKILSTLVLLIMNILLIFVEL